MIPQLTMSSVKDIWFGFMLNCNIFILKMFKVRNEKTFLDFVELHIDFIPKRVITSH